MNTLEHFKAYLNRINQYEQATMLIHWDMATCMPKNGAPASIDALTMLSTESFKLMVSDEMGDFLHTLSKPETLAEMDEISRKMVTECKKNYDENKNIPQEVYQRYVKLTSESEHVWESAKHADDFETMAPYLNEIINLTKEIMDYTKPGIPTYDALLDNYEKGLTEAKVTELFKTLRVGIVPLIEAISQKTNIDDNLFKGNFDTVSQEKLAHYFLNVIGFDFSSGCMGVSEHPFTTGNAPHDVRITTHYDPSDIRSSLFSILHEGGHALYEQHIHPALIGTRLNTGTSMGIHESQSRFYENILGRNFAFWEKHYAAIQDMVPSYKSISLSDFYKGINRVEPSFIRIDADELTYNLHIIIRFELESALFSGKLSISDLPAAWNGKMKEYLGIVPPDYKTGVLQDVHWPSGLMGYFPSYALGNIYSCQFLSEMEKELGAIDELIPNDKLCDITKWLSTHIHQHGSMKTPTEIIQDTCHTSIDAAPVIKYYTDKYSKLYQL